MSAQREPKLHSVPIDELHPTQITIGLREVEAKRKRWRQRQQEKQANFLGSHMIPVIRGPKDHYYVIDHHHLSRALLEEGVESIAVTVVADLRRLEGDEFWTFLDNRNWMHPFDEEGRRRDHHELPKKVALMRDDPYRSLAGELRRAGGFAKDTTPFSEFLWADFLRRRVKREQIEADFTLALSNALSLAKDRGADYLPGWCGPVSEE